MARPKGNVELAARVADLVDEVRATRALAFVHVKGHSGDVGNDAADLYADRGRLGWVTPQWPRVGTSKKNVSTTRYCLRHKRLLSSP